MLYSKQILDLFFHYKINRSSDIIFRASFENASPTSTTSIRQHVSKNSLQSNFPFRKKFYIFFTQTYMFDTFMEHNSLAPYKNWMSKCFKNFNFPDRKHPASFIYVEKKSSKGLYVWNAYEHLKWHHFNFALFSLFHVWSS